MMLALRVYRMAPVPVQIGHSKAGRNEDVVAAGFGTTQDRVIPVIRPVIRLAIITMETATGTVEKTGKWPSQRVLAVKVAVHPGLPKRNNGSQTMIVC